MNGNNKSLLEIAIINSNKAATEKNTAEKKETGQFFTPTSIAKFMAKMSIINTRDIRILDPGAGTGILSAALLDEIINNNCCSSVELVLFENDKTIVPYLEELMEKAKIIFSKNNTKFKYKIMNDDFILYYRDIFCEECTIDYFDIVISNPPYFKVPSKHEYSNILTNYIHGQPNVYFMFMIVCTKLLKENGQLIFLTPRSYCSGLYFKKFRSFLLDNIDPIQFHLFKSRKKIFNSEKVIQEIIILNGIKRGFSDIFTKISSSSADPFIDYKEEFFRKKYIYLKKHNELLIRLPLNKEQEKIINTFDSWSNDISKMGIGISTGPVVPFRCNGLLEEFVNDKSYPLFFMKHIKNGELNYPLSNTDLGIKKSKSSKNILIPAKNYLLVKRFSSSEQKRRIECCFFDKSNYNYSYIGIENHLNYLYKKTGDFSNDELYGLYVFLNSKTVDEYFRIVNGNTQVNAYDINLLPLPNKNVLISLGKEYLKIEETKRNPKFI
ncbi:Eco57I restriction-modification methylase domain-containing protein [Peribacillus butanolivorans]|uniref:Eco57I restriction-modification methylase domain-containing protein n=1 Tax=Peribacillus butanolivorans TaxID=421767 RepID=UPI003659698D